MRTAKPRRIAATTLALALATLACTFALAAAPTMALADEEGSSSVDAKWHSHTIYPGETYDIGSAKRNTTVYIKKPGAYYLHGSSSSMHLEISSGDVTLYLNDGLDINTGIYSNVGQCSPGIIIGDQGGTVTICTRKNAVAKVSGYLGGAGIQKDGTNTKLVFTTEDPNNPGKLIVKGSNSIEGGAGIGTSSHAMFTSRTTGNIVIESGIIEATGYVNSAGIGGGDHGTLSGLTINGGTVTAAGGNNIGWVGGGGAGIGGGNMGSANSITINGGTVTATGGASSAGIGGGNRSSSIGGKGRNITINGGTVTATGGQGGAGIGGGWEADANGIKITGGTVYAHGGKVSGCGIGGGGGNFNGTGSNIVISGGQVTATSKSTASRDAVIGSSKTGNGTTSISISGGTVNIQTDAEYGIGGGGNQIGTKKGSTRVTISGGTVSITSKKQGIGSSNSNTTISIIGGSVFSSVAPKAVNQRGDQVFPTTIALEGVNEAKAVKSATITNVSPTYGMKDVTTSADGKLCFWLPKDGEKSVEVTQAVLGEATYTGSVKAGESGTLRALTSIILDANGGQKPGSATADIGAENIQIASEPERRGYEPIGYSSEPSDPDNTRTVATNSGSLQANTPYTDASAKWNRPASQGPVTLYTQWRGQPYTVRYDANKPADTASEVSGDTPEIHVTHGTPFRAASCGYALPGYSFAGWNTKADGTGTSYATDAYIDDLPDEDGTATLYATWTPKTYSITFTAGGETGDIRTQELTYDTPEALAANTFTALSTGATFLGWRCDSRVGSFWKDEAQVCNLCSFYEGSDVPQGLTLTAVWSTEGVVNIAMTNNNSPVTGQEDAISLRNAEGATCYGFFEEQSSGSGVYVCEDAVPGTYTIWHNDSCTGKTVTVKSGKTAVVHLDYCTVDIKGNEHCAVSIERASNSPTPLAGTTNGTTKLEGVLVGSRVRIATTVNPGYGFRGYKALDCDPTWEGGDASKPSQTVTVNGQTTIIATTGPARYSIKFDANGGSGSMDAQELVYGESAPLSVNLFTREHYSFAGWTTTPTWTGTLYADAQEVKDLTDIDGTVLTFYAQWTNDAYWIEFNGNGGDVGFMELQKAFVDQPTQLQKSTMSMEGYRFVGWNTEADGSGTAYADEEEVLNLTTERDTLVTLWAQWEEETPEPSPTPSPDDPDSGDSDGSDKAKRLAGTGDTAAARFAALAALAALAGGAALRQLRRTR